VVLDASGDQANTWFTLGGSMALARADAGVDIALDPTTMVPRGLAPGQVVRPWAYGTFTRSVGAYALPEEGDIWVCKLGWWAGAPWDVVAYARNHPTFPGDSSLEQLYDAAEFDAYRQLGASTVLAAAMECRPPLRSGPVLATRAEGTRGVVNSAADPGVEDRIAARVREALIGDPLDAFEGLLVVQLLDLGGEATAPGRQPEIRAGSEYRIVAYLAQAAPESAAAIEPVMINGPRRPTAVGFTISALSDKAAVSPGQVRIHAPADADSEHAEFSFVAPEESAPLTLWVQLHQRDALIQVARLELNPEVVRVAR
jgi:hypothetical protein